MRYGGRKHLTAKATEILIFQQILCLKLMKIISLDRGGGG